MIVQGNSNMNLIVQKVMGVKVPDNDRKPDIVKASKATIEPEGFGEVLKKALDSMEDMEI